MEQVQAESLTHEVKLLREEIALLRDVMRINGTLMQKLIEKMV